ncbi:MAG TPA: T9SS type A sorting domain-containing protein [Bacteroidia bacterium]|jgi:plastocyanin|nr:T9SS type A sorting domain-containing protein [Bacteroidia bacterium]
MKHKLLFSLSVCLTFVSISQATIHTVTCQNTPSHFLPVTTNASIGDTILWTWVAGTHVVGPIATTDIPAGAPMWNAPIDASDHSFKYVVTVAGNYHYVCHPATPHGEDAYIVVASVATGIPEYNSKNSIGAFPNPFSEKITLETTNADLLVISNAAGQRVASFPVKSGQTKLEADLGTLPKGVYFYILLKEGVVLETRKIIKAY